MASTEQMRVVQAMRSGIECGKVGPSTFDVPDGCRFITALPAGIGFYCCPCGG